jgi:hypothetical protein
MQGAQGLIDPRARLERARQEWPEPLLPSAAYRALLEAAQGAPELSSGVFLECHLADELRTDLVVRVHRGCRDRLLERGRLTAKVERFFRRWSDPSEELGFIPAVDLEVDLDGGGGDFRVCPLFEPELLRGHRAIQDTTERRRAQGLDSLALDHGARLLRVLDERTPARVLTVLGDCARALPAHGSCIPGWPNSDLGTSARVMCAMPRYSLAGYLKRIAWPGDVAELEAVASHYWADAAWANIDLDLTTSGVGPRIGLYWEVGRVTPRNASFPDLLSRLGESGWALPTRLSGLADWIQAQPARPEGDNGRSLSLKLVLAAGAKTVLKAYLSEFDETGTFQADERYASRWEH